MEGVMSFVFSPIGLGIAGYLIMMVVRGITLDTSHTSVVDFGPMLAWFFSVIAGTVGLLIAAVVVYYTGFVWAMLAGPTVGYLLASATGLTPWRF